MDSDFADILGTSALPPLVYRAGSVDPNSALLPLSATSTSGPASPGLTPPVSPGAGASSPGLDVPLKPPATGASPIGGIDLQQILGLRPQQPQSALSPGSQFMASLGAGLSSAGQNWNKPALAAFAGGAGVALQGGQQWNNQQQEAKLKALHAAIAAWKVGDIAAYHQAIAALRAASAGKRAPAPVAPPAPPPPISSGQPEPQSASLGPADPATAAAHRTALEHMFAAADVPPHRLDAADMERAAALMGSKALSPAEAFEVAIIRNAIDAGHVSPHDVDLIYGPGAADAIHSTATS